MQSGQVNTGGLLVVRVEVEVVVGSSLVHSKPEGEWIEGVRVSEGRLQAAAWGADALVEGRRGGEKLLPLGG